ncbi:MAG: hypothetical protein RIK85_15520 [Marinobacter sp.]
MKPLSKGTGVLALAVALNGCSPSGPSSDGSANVASDQLVTLSGRAAVGAPIANAPVDARCTGGKSFIESVTTDESGGFLGEVEPSALPCALRVTGNGEDKLLHSYADSAGTVNITPFTDLIIALSASMAPMDWFERDEFASDVGSLNLARVEFLNALQEAGYNLPGDGFDPFLSSFQINDAVDQLLDTFSAAVRNIPNVEDYQSFVDLISSGNLEAIPEAPPPEDDGSGSGGDDGDNGGDNDDDNNDEDDDRGGLIDILFG